MLEFYEAFQKCDVPKALENEIFESGQPLRFINELNKVNVFIGANNSGKSRILRELLKMRRATFYSDANANKIIQLFNTFFDEVTKLHSIPGFVHDTVRTPDGRLVFDFSLINALEKTAKTLTGGYEIKTQFSNLKPLIKNVTLASGERIFVYDKHRENKGGLMNRVEANF